MSCYLLYSDGACSGNNSSKQCTGGYGYVIVDPANNTTIEGGGRIACTTNNRMELTAVIQGLKRLKKYAKLVSVAECIIYTDSKYVCDNYNDYLKIWKSNGWHKTNGQSVLNIDLWKDMDKETSEFKSINFTWVKGHASNKYNNRCDQIARSSVNLHKHI